MRIAVNAQSYEAGNPSGIATYTEYLYKYIWNMDMTNKYVFFASKVSRELKNHAKDRVKFHSAPSPRANKYVRVGWENIVFPIQLCLNNVDLLHCVNYSLPFAVPVRIKKVITVHDLIWFKFPEYFPKDTLFAAKKRLLHACSVADCIITVSENTKTDVLEVSHCKEEKVAVIHEGIDIKHFNRAPKEDSLATVIRSKYSLPQQFILWVGSYRKHKNVENLCKAFALAKEKHKLAHKLVLCGPRLLQEEAVNDILKNFGNNIMVIGPVEYEELPVIYKLADAFLFPSLYEGFGLPVLEAMASGIPVITSNTSSLPEVAGDAALLVNPLCVDEIAEALTRVIEDNELRLTLIAKGIERAGKFSWEDTAYKTLKLFSEVGS
jgi:glycosyltransferase involved in cell wall biosynthesis